MLLIAGEIAYVYGPVPPLTVTTWRVRALPKVVPNPVIGVTVARALTVITTTEVEEAPRESESVTVSVKVPTFAPVTVIRPVAVSIVIPAVVGVIANARAPVPPVEVNVSE